jgi:hypothetical protein
MVQIAMSTTRLISSDEKGVITALLMGKGAPPHLMKSLDDLLVVEMSDGRMGSLSLRPKNRQGAAAAFGQQLALGEFNDSDDVLVSLALNLDTDGNLFELDVWKVNFTPLLKWPNPNDIRITG